MVFKGDLEGDLRGTWRGTLRGTWRGTLRGNPKGTLRGNPKGTSEETLNRTWKGTSCQAQVRSGPGLVQVWFSLKLKFNSFGLDSEVGRLVKH